jgi:acetyl esterase/lipase
MADIAIVEERGQVAERPFVLLSCGSAKSDRLLIVLHGGCWATGDETSNEPQCREWTRRLGVATLRYHFALSDYAATLASLIALVEWAQQQRFCMVGLVGCSSGGQLALGLALALHRSGKPLPAFVLCLAPVVHPADRHAYLTSDSAPPIAATMREQQLVYWRSVDAMQAAGDELFAPDAHACWTAVPHGVHLVFGDVQDVNVPRSLSDAWAARWKEVSSPIAIEWLPQASHAFCYRTGQVAVLARLEQLLAKLI